MVPAEQPVEAAISVPVRRGRRSLAMRCTTLGGVRGASSAGATGDP
jgi:hypothetical protein